MTDNIFSKCILTRSINLKLNEVNRIDKNLLKIITRKISGKCIKEGLVRSGSIKVLSHSSGLLVSNSVQYELIIECEVCNPVEGMEIECKVENITKAGIKSKLDMEDSPMIIFIARDHHYKNKNFSKVKEGDMIRVKIVGQRYELNDKFVSVIGELINDKKKKLKIKLT